MNRQGKVVGGKVVGGIGWTRTRHPDGTETPGYTLNVGRGCMFGCRWQMPDGTIAQCYAKSVAEGIASKSYPHGFEHYTFDPKRLDDPGKVKEPAGFFLDSMSDMLGHWVPDQHIEDILEMCSRYNHHKFFILTKNSPRLSKWVFPPNVAIGVSSPPDWMNGKRLTLHQQQVMLGVALRNLGHVNHKTFFNPVRWVSFEPLSWDVSDIVHLFVHNIDWAVIGAASNGSVKHQPDPEHVQKLLDVLDSQNVKVYFKSNLTWHPDRKELAF